MLDVGIVGAGTAGCATAALLGRAGHRVTLYERFAAPQPVGAGIVMQPSGLAVLRRLGLAEAIVAHGARIDRLRCQTSFGRGIVDLPYRLLHGDWFGVGLHRGVLFEAVFAAARAAGAEIQCGVEAHALGYIGDRACVVDAAGRRGRAHDLVVVADGARSTLREQLAPETGARVRSYPWGALWFTAEDSDGSFCLPAEGELFQVVEGTRKMLGLLPTGLAPRGTARLVSIYWSLRADAVDEWRSLGLAAWKRELLHYAPRAAPLLAQLHDPAQVLFAGYHDVTMRRWHTRNVVFLGDAAHAMSPQLGQGCNLALYDAWTLSEALAVERPLPARLADYARRRRAHLGFYQHATRWLTPFFQSNGGLGWLRDVGMALAARVPWVRRQMVASMCGVKSGLFGTLDRDSLW